MDDLITRKGKQFFDGLRTTPVHKITKAYNIEIEGIDTADAPDFADAFISYAEHVDGTPFTDAQLDAINEDSDFVYRAVMDFIY